MFVLKSDGKYYVADDEELTNVPSRATQYKTREEAESECMLVTELWAKPFKVIELVTWESDPSLIETLGKLR